MNHIGSIPEIILKAHDASLREHLYSNLELKEKWRQEDGKKLSALANSNIEGPSWLVVGITDSGKVTGRDDRWAKKQEELISQHVNDHLDPFQTCAGIACCETNFGYIVVITLENPGDVVYWNRYPYRASGTTITQMSPDEILQLRIRLPGLTDYSSQVAVSSYSPELLRRFQDRLYNTDAPIGSTATGSELLRQLEIHHTQVSRILFGPCPFRFVAYDGDGYPYVNERLEGLYRILTDDFISRIQRRAESGDSGRYPDKALREALSNAVAHSAYFEDDGDIIIEVYNSRITISNLCHKESLYFANRWFSRSHKTVNSLLMEVLRVARHVDELGRGKHLIFSECIKAGREVPEVFVEPAGRYLRWKLTLYGGEHRDNQIRLLERTIEAYRDEQKGLIAFALILWREKPVAEIRKYVDGDFSRQFAQVLSSVEGPVLYNQRDDKIILKRWASVLLGQGQDSMGFTSTEEDVLKTMAFSVCRKYSSGELTPRMLRELGQMGNTRSEQTLSSSILRRWVAEGLLQRLARGRYKFSIEPPVRTPEQQRIVEILETGKPPASPPVR